MSQHEVRYVKWRGWADYTGGGVRAARESEDHCHMNPFPLDASDLTVDMLGKSVNIQHSDAHKGFLRGRLVEIRHRFAADGSTPATRVKLELFEGDSVVVVTLTLGPDMRLQR